MSNRRNKTEIIVVILSVAAVIISSVGTYVSFFYQNNELSIVFSKVSISGTTLTVEMSWVNSGNKSISLSNIGLASANKLGESNSRSSSTSDKYERVSSIYLRPGDITTKSLYIKDFQKSLNKKDKMHLILNSSIVTSGGTFKKIIIELGEIKIKDNDFSFEGYLGSYKYNSETHMLNSQSETQVYKLSL